MAEHTFLECRLCHCCGDAPDRHGEILNVWVERAEQAEAALRERDGRYHELLYAVGHKFPDESRHDTALRYIRQAEVPDGKQEGQMMSSLPAAAPKGGQ